MSMSTSVSISPMGVLQGCRKLGRCGRRGSPARQIARDCGDAGLLQVCARMVYCGQLRRLPRLPRPCRRDADKTVVVGGRMTLISGGCKQWTYLVGSSGQGCRSRRGTGGSRARRGRSSPCRRVAAEDRPGDVCFPVSGSINRVHSGTTLQATTGSRLQDQLRHWAFGVLVDYHSLTRYRDLVLRPAPPPRMY